MAKQHAAAPPPTSPAPPALTLARLLQDYRSRTGESYADIARKTGMSKAQVGILVTGSGPHVPRRETLTALATGLALPLATVQAAAAGSAGLDSAGADATATAAENELLATYRTLTPEARSTVRTLVNALAREARERQS